jgi:poly(glycerol-phosphate) alpha-glucosyltransferase
MLKASSFHIFPNTMHIVHILSRTSRNAGGLFETVSGLAHALKHYTHNGIQTSAIGVFDDKFIPDRHQWKCPINVMPPVAWLPEKLLYAPGMYPFLLAEEASVVFCHGLWTHHNLVTLQWARKTGRPFVMVPHGMLDIVDLNKSRLQKWVASKLYMDQLFQKAACVRAISQSEAESIRAYGVRVPICLIPNGVDLPPAGEVAPPAWRQALPAGAKVLFYIGRIHPKKGLPALIEAWGRVTPADPCAAGWHLVIAGWDQAGHEAELKAQVEKLSLGRTVHFVGPLFNGDKDAAFRHVDAFVLPSKSEGLPTVVLEAWSYEVPVLMTPQCNLPEGFAAGAAVRMETNADSIAGSLRQFFRLEEAERKKMAANGRALVANKFAWSAIAAETMALCKWILGTGPKPDCVDIV